MKIDKTHIDSYATLDFFAKQIVEGFITGLHKSPFHGFSVEFSEHKLYNSGESTKHIDWKLYGKTDRLYVKRYEEETNLRCHIALDISSSMYYPSHQPISFSQPNKISFSVYAAAALMLLMKKQRDAVALTTFSDRITLSTQARTSETHHNFLLSEMEKLFAENALQKEQKTDIPNSLHLLAEQIHKRSLVVIFTDMLVDPLKQEQLFSALQHLKHKKHEVILFYVFDKEKEFDLDFPQRPYQFIDMETGEKVKLIPEEIQKRYQEIRYDFFKTIKLKCAQHKIEFVEANIQLGFDQILLPFLLRRSKLY